jgi:thioesterase domain-containing protein
LDRKALAAPAGPAYAARSYEAPVGDVETALARIWARVLKLERVGRHDDFFALGGHSLLVMKVASLLKQVDIDMTVVDLFKHPTIESLAASLEDGRHEATVKGAVAVRTTGAEKPLFLIHENTGQDLWFSLLAAQINSEIPVYGLQAVPLDELQLQTVEGMASRLARIMRTVQPVGPYRFAGWSLGGVLAYEVAIQLIGQDQAVEFVGLLDAGCPNSPPRTDPSRRREASPQAHLLALCEGLEREVPLTAGQQAILSELKCSAGESDFEDLFRQCRESGVLHPSFVDHTAQEVRRYIGRLMAHWHAIENYVAQPISIPIYLFAAEEPLAAVSGEPAPPDPLMGWGSVAPERQIHVVRVPGNHLTLMDDSHITALGRALSDAIAQAGKPRPNPPETEYRSIVSLNTGKRGNTSVFCVPGAGGNVIGFIELSVALGQEWPLYGLQPRGVEGALAPHSTVEAAATMCRREIEAVQPSGEIHLLGHSFGGWVAFEIATQMRAAGRSVSSLTIIDSEAPDGDGLRSREYTSLEVLMELIEVMELAAEKKLGIQSAELESEDETGRLRLLHEGLLRVGLLPARSAPDTLRGAVRAFGATLRTSYRPRQPYTAPLRLALARDPRHDDQTNEREHHNILVGWRKWAPDIECWYGPGNHFTLLKAPHAQVLAEWWRGGLRLITK